MKKDFSHEIVVDLPVSRAFSMFTPNDYVHEIHKGINAQRKSVKGAVISNYGWDQFVQWALIIMAFLTTIFTALAKSYPEMTFTRHKIELTFLPVIFAALVTLTTSAAAYCNFNVKVERDRSISMDLGKLLSDMIVEVRRDVAIGKALGGESIIEKDAPTTKRKTTEEWLLETDAWMKRLDEILRRDHPKS